MAIKTLANVYRPKRFEDVVGQGSEIQVLRQIVDKGWMPPSLILTGPFGVGKTSLARLFARAVLCEQREGIEPCGRCKSCEAMDKENHPAFIEKDSASYGSVADIRAIKDEILYAIGYPHRIYLLDESHMISQAGQNAFLQLLEEGVPGVTFAFATTEEHRMFGTMRSRSIILKLRLLTVQEIVLRLRKVTKEHGIEAEPRALSLIASYARGHLRDALILLEQLAKMAPKVDEQLTRTYLRLDKRDELYKLLTETDKKAQFSFLEQLLCTYAAGELAELLGEILLNCYKQKLGIDANTQLDEQWGKKIIETRGNNLLETAEEILRMPLDFASINLGIAGFGRILQGEGGGTQKPNGLWAGKADTPMPMVVAGMRKPRGELTNDGPTARRS